MKVRRNHLRVSHDCQSSIKLTSNNRILCDVNYTERFYYATDLYYFPDSIYTLLYYCISLIQTFYFQSHFDNLTNGDCHYQLLSLSTLSSLTSCISSCGFLELDDNFQRGERRIAKRLQEDSVVALSRSNSKFRHRPGNR